MYSAVCNVHIEAIEHMPNTNSKCDTQMWRSNINEYNSEQFRHIYNCTSYVMKCNTLF